MYLYMLRARAIFQRYFLARGEIIGHTQSGTICPTAYIDCGRQTNVLKEGVSMEGRFKVCLSGCVVAFQILDHPSVEQQIGFKFQSRLKGAFCDTQAQQWYNSDNSEVTAALRNQDTPVRSFLSHVGAYSGM